MVGHRLRCVLRHYARDVLSLSGVEHARRCVAASPLCVGGGDRNRRADLAHFLRLSGLVEAASAVLEGPLLMRLRQRALSAVSILAE